MQSPYNDTPLYWQPLLTESLPWAWSCAGDFPRPIPDRHYYPHFMVEIIIPRCTLSHWWTGSGPWNQWHPIAMWPDGSCDVMDILCWQANLINFPHGLSTRPHLLNTAISTSHQDHVSKDCESSLLSEKLPLILSGKTKKAPALKLAE